jgi:hypothetical protein
VISKFSKFLKLRITKSNNKSVLPMSTRNRNNNDGGIKAFLLGLGLGAIGYAILSFYLEMILSALFYLYYKMEYLVQEN